MTEVEGEVLSSGCPHCATYQTVVTMEAKTGLVFDCMLRQSDRRANKMSDGGSGDETENTDKEQLKMRSCGSSFGDAVVDNSASNFTTCSCVFGFDTTCSSVFNVSLPLSVLAQEMDMGTTATRPVCWSLQVA